MEKNPIIGFQVDPAQIRYIGNDLQRPECILAEPNGTLWAADARGGVARISPDGAQEIITQSFDATFTQASDERGKPFVNKGQNHSPYNGTQPCSAPAKQGH